MKIIRYVLLTVATIVLLVASVNLASNFKNLLNSSQIVCNNTAGATGGCLPPQVEPDLVLIIVSGVVLGLVIGWLGHSYFLSKKVK
jgi:divalent metal cation (Fe/Co/Zn/Cd) transporter